MKKDTEYIKVKIIDKNDNMIKETEKAYGFKMITSFSNRFHFVAKSIIKIENDTLYIPVWAFMSLYGFRLCNSKNIINDFFSNKEYYEI